MSRHNRRRRRHGRHGRHQDESCWDLSNSNSFGSANAASRQSFWQNRNASGRTFFRLPSFGAQAFTTPFITNSAISRQRRPNTSKGSAVTPGSPSISTISSHNWRAHKAMMDHDQDCDSICKGMTNVVEYLFDGSMDYDDEELERKSAAYRHSNIRHPNSNIHYHGVII